jgi:hypothetical protein
MSTAKSQSKSLDAETLVEQYKVYVEMTDRLSSRRFEANRFYSTILTGLFAVLSFAIDQAALNPLEREIIFLGVSIFGIILSILWFVNIRSYRLINSAKFKVINEMEKHLSFPCYEREWKIINGGKGEHGYFQFTTIERFVPLIFLIPYAILAIYSIYNIFA